MDRVQLEAFFNSDRGVGHKLTNEDYAELLKAANSDSHEGVEWLPYYKMALARLAECCGLLRVLAERDGSEQQRRKVLFEAAELYHQHLLLSGHGPMESAEAVDRVNRRASEARRKFIDPRG